MKKIYIIFLIIITIILASFDLRNYHKFQILAAKSPSKLVVDLNKNAQIDDNEIVGINGIKDFEYNNNIISNAQTLYINYLFSRWAKINLYDKFVALEKKNSKYKIKLDDKEYAEIVLDEGFTIPEGEEYKKYFSQISLNNKLKPISEEKLVLLNRSNKKYHKLDCKYARRARNYSIISLKSAIDSGFRPCNHCYLSHKMQHTTHTYNIPAPVPYIKTQDIDVYFIDSSNTIKPDNSCSQIACRTLLNEINTAKKSIDIAIYGIEDQPKLLKAILSAQNRSVKIRLVTDVDEKGATYYKDNRQLINNIKSNLSDSNSYPKYIMHDKFLVFDNKKVWTGSSNLTSTDFSNFNTNYNILTSSPNIVNAYVDEFDLLFSGKFHLAKQKCNSSTSAAYFSPQDEIIKSKIIPLIDSSKSYVYMPIFYLTHKELTETLINAKKRGVDVRVIVDATNAHAKYSVHKKLRDAGIQVKTENKAGKLHAKMIVIDDKYSVIGSMNFTKSGEKYNDENVIIVENTAIAKYLKSTFIYLWKTIPAKYLKYDPYAESKASIGSCSDGIDNDFDGKIDKEEKYCN